LAGAGVGTASLAGTSLGTTAKVSGSWVPLRLTVDLYGSAGLASTPAGTGVGTAAGVGWHRVPPGLFIDIHATAGDASAAGEVFPIIGSVGHDVFIINLLFIHISHFLFHPLRQLRPVGRHGLAQAPEGLGQVQVQVGQGPQGAQGEGQPHVRLQHAALRGELRHARLVHHVQHGVHVGAELLVGQLAQPVHELGGDLLGVLLHLPVVVGPRALLVELVGGLLY